jgi:hypothetical protein
LLIGYKISQYHNTGSGPVTEPALLPENRSVMQL